MSLLTALTSATGALKVLERGLDVSQANVSNVNSPGFARQRLTITSRNEGIIAGPIFSARDNYSESAVWNRQSGLGKANQGLESLGQLQQVLPIGEGAGIAASITGLFQSFSQLAVSPNSTTSRQVVLDRAGALASTINSASKGLGTAAQSAEREVGSNITKINSLLSEIAQVNKASRENFNSREQGGVEARSYKALEELSEYTNFTALTQADGTISVFLANQTLAVVGDRSLPLKAVVAGNQTQIQDSTGKDITTQFTTGRLGGLIDFRNSAYPKYSGALDTLATTLADRINTVLNGGLDQNGNPPAANLFQYDTVAGAAATFSVNGLKTQDLAIASAGLPGGSGNAYALTDLSKTGQINGLRFSEFYGSIAAGVGRDISFSQQEQTTQTQLLQQARTIRQDNAGVSLDQEAAYIVQIQRGYQAAAKLISVITQLTDVTLSLLK